MPTTEHTINDAVAEHLRRTRRSWRGPDIISSENTGMLKGSSARPDILVIEPNVSPVTLEAEVLPAATVESEAIARLGSQLRTNGRKVLSSIAVRYPQRLRAKSGAALKNDLARAPDLEMVLYTGSGPQSATRWPHSGWLIGNVADLSVLTQAASVPPDVVEEAADQLVTGVSEAAALLYDMVQAHAGAIHSISAELRQENGEQTRRMATTILANAFVFQETVAGGPGKLSNVRSIEQMRGSTTASKSEVLAEWRKILEVNYWPIFDIARRILEHVPTSHATGLIDSLASTAEKLLENRLMRSHDLTGAVFQRLIADRKFLAAYYTTPASAALLVGLAIAPETPPQGGDWGKAADVAAMRIADFACGTGTLLSTAYQRVGQLHELAGGDAESLHPELMATALVGCDVLPAAAHLTASMLAGAHPTVKYVQSGIMTVAYGRQRGGGIALGSIDLLDGQGRFKILDITTAKSAGGMGEAQHQTWTSLPHASFDVVIMNPPFTRATGQEGKKVGVPNPMFAAFRAPPKEQRLMAKATKELTEGTSAHGNAGEASIFLVLADRKLKPDGIIALVLPLSLMSGDAWEQSRQLLAKSYTNLVVVSISGEDGAEVSFSADTDIGECLVVGRKSTNQTKRATFVVLKRRPEFPLVGATAATQIRRIVAAKGLRNLEDGPSGGTDLVFGSDIIGQAIEAPLPTRGGWKLARVADIALAQTAYQLAEEGRLWLPAMQQNQTTDLPITTVEQLGEIGPYHMDIDATSASGGLRGPFTISRVKAGGAPTYPALWAHDAANQRTMLFDADSEGIPRKGTAAEQVLISQKVAKLWKTASHCHFNRDFRFNSQSTSMQFTPRRTIGGRAWISILLASESLEKALVAWANTSLGVLAHWWHANKQQAGRGSVGVSALQSFPVLDVSALTAKQLKAAVSIFDKLSGAPFLPVHKLDRDGIRSDLDEQFGAEVLGLDPYVLAPGGPMEVLRMKLAREPSILGHK